MPGPEKSETGTGGKIFGKCARSGAGLYMRVYTRTPAGAPALSACSCGTWAGSDGSGGQRGATRVKNGKKWQRDTSKTSAVSARFTIVKRGRYCEAPGRGGCGPKSPGKSLYSNYFFHGFVTHSKLAIIIPSQLLLFACLVLRNGKNGYFAFGLL